MIIVLTGPNDYARMSALKKISDDFVDKYGDFGLEKIDASVSEYGRLLENVASLPFLAERRMIVLAGIQSNSTLVNDVSKLIDATSDTTDLIIDEAKFDKRLSLYKILKKKAEIRDFKELDERSIVNWLVSEARVRGASLSLVDANKIVLRAGNNQMLLSNELNKLINYSPKISSGSIEELVSPIPSSSIFELIDSVFSGNKARAIEIYTDQRMQRVEPQAIMGMIAWQLHIIAIVKFNYYRSVEDIASSTKINPFVIRKTQNLVSKLSEAEVRHLISKAVKVDYRLKTYNIDADEAIQNFIVTI